MRKISYLVAHCTASPQTQTVKTILDYWKRVKGWDKPGYHFLIKPDGEAVNILPIEEVSNGVAGHNSNAIHLAYIGGIASEKVKIKEVEYAKGYPIDNRTDAQKKTMLELLQKFNNMFPSAVILGHRDFSVDKNRNGIVEPSEWLKSCPSFSVKTWLQEVKFKTAMPFSLFRTTTAVNIREGAGTNFKPITAPLAKDTRVKKLAEANGWTYVELYGTEISGWIKSEFLT